MIDLLDTNAISDLLREKEPVKIRFTRVRDRASFILCPVVDDEIRRGLLLGLCGKTGHPNLQSLVTPALRCHASPVALCATCPDGRRYEQGRFGYPEICTPMELSTEDDDAGS